MREIPASTLQAVVAPEDQGPAANISAEARHLMIAEAAHLRALSRGFEAGDADADWYAAEAEINQLLGG
jgi:hypothetical protein